MPPPSELGTVVAKIEAMDKRQSEIITNLRELTTAVGKLAVIEERQSNDRQATERAFLEIKRLDTDIRLINNRLEKLEQAQPMTGFTNGIVMKAIGLVLAFVIGANLNSLVSKPTTAVTIAAPSK